MDLTKPESLDCEEAACDNQATWGDGDPLVDTDQVILDLNGGSTCVKIDVDESNLPNSKIQTSGCTNSNHVVCEVRCDVHA